MTPAGSPTQDAFDEAQVEPRTVRLDFCAAAFRRAPRWRSTASARAVPPSGPPTRARRRDAMRSSRRNAGWPLERVLFALAGTMTLLAAGLAALVSPWFLLLAAFVGVNQWLYVLVGACPASIVLGRLFALRSAVYTRAGARS